MVYRRHFQGRTSLNTRNFTFTAVEEIGVTGETSSVAEREGVKIIQDDIILYNVEWLLHPFRHYDVNRDYFSLILG